MTYGKLSNEVLAMIVLSAVLPVLWFKWRRWF
jgi:Mg2+ and Co2+ transporter CorA